MAAVVTITVQATAVQAITTVALAMATLTKVLLRQVVQDLVIHSKSLLLIPAIIIGEASRMLVAVVAVAQALFNKPKKMIQILQTTTTLIIVVTIAQQIAVQQLVTSTVQQTVLIWHRLCLVFL